MKFVKLYHVKNVDSKGNIVEIKIWKVKKTQDKPHGLKYSLLYIEKGKRIKL